MNTVYEKLIGGLVSGIQKGGAGFFWILKIIIPISFLTFLIEYSGWIYRIEFLLAPALNLLGLPPMAALPLIAGMLSGTVGGIASMVMLPFTQAQMTLIAVFLLIAHNLIQEGIIQGKSGLHPWKATAVRIIAAVFAVVLIAQIIGEEPATKIAVLAERPTGQPFGVVLKIWSVKTFYLSVKIFIIIMVLMWILETMKRFNMIPSIVRLIKPILRMMGLDQQVGILWLTAVFFGIAYGAAVIVEEAKEKNITTGQLTRLQISIGINHSMIDDPGLYLAVGIPPFWLWVPRLVMAILVVQAYNFFFRCNSLFNLIQWVLKAKR
jgi:Fe2+ transport system protein B